TSSRWVLSPGRISLAVETEVSEPTFEGSVTSAGSLWPIIGKEEEPRHPCLHVARHRKREASTTVELPSGGSIVIAGLVRDDIRQGHVRHARTDERADPSALCSARATSSATRTELVIIATPYLVRPMVRSKLARPDGHFNPETDVSGFFLNRVNKIYGRKEKQPGAYNGTIGLYLQVRRDVTMGQ
ncbi:MAG: hypothetical protein KL863_19520, partial [Rhizobium sp.]|nr:hypothetical protein [Rhizobium sp.]